MKNKAEKLKIIAKQLNNYIDDFYDDLAKDKIDAKAGKWLPNLRLSDQFMIDSLKESSLKICIVLDMLARSEEK